MQIYANLYKWNIINHNIVIRKFITIYINLSISNFTKIISLTKLSRVSSHDQNLPTTLEVLKHLTDRRVISLARVRQEFISRTRTRIVVEVSFLPIKESRGREY